MKKIIEWLKSRKSDFILFILVLVLINVVGQSAYLRLDLTRQGTYSLSEVSKQTVSSLTQPLSVKVFFSKNLPSSYTKIYQYVKDMLVEYNNVSNSNFSYQIFNMDKKENEAIAQGYGLRQIEIDEIKNNEASTKAVWMGLAISYGDTIETINAITSEQGFEYNLTTKISQIISKTDSLALLGEDDKVKVTYYLSDSLKRFRIAGLEQAEGVIQEAFDKVNKMSLGRLEYTKVSPDKNESVSLEKEFGLQTFQFQNKDKEMDTGTFGLVIQYKDRFKVIPLNIVSTLFGYTVNGLNDIEKNISDNLQGLFAKVSEIGYISGNEEELLTDQQGNSTHLVSMLEDMYSLKKIDLRNDDIPGNLSSIIINNAKGTFQDKELYKIDQFLMRGGNVMIFNSSFDMKQENPYMPPIYTPIENGLSKILDKYGVSLRGDYVFDENCYKANRKIPLYWAPVLDAKGLNQKNPITKNLGYVIFLYPGSIDATEALKNKDLNTTVLAKSSNASWTQKENVNPTPSMSTPYDKSTEKSENLCVLVEGKFTSAFDKDPEEVEAKDSSLTTTTHIAKARSRGKLFVASSGDITSNQLIDKDGSEPIAIFVRNAIDYMNGNEALCSMRTKGTSFLTIEKNTGVLASIIENLSVYLLAAIVIIIGIVVYFKRQAHKKAIHDMYNPNDARMITK